MKNIVIYKSGKTIFYDDKNDCTFKITRRSKTKPGMIVINASAEANHGLPPNIEGICFPLFISYNARSVKYPFTIYENSFTEKVTVVRSAHSLQIFIGVFRIVIF